MNDRDDSDSNFLSRWSRRKAQVRQGVVPPEVAPREPSQPALADTAASAQRDAAAAQPPRDEMPVRPAVTPPSPTLDDVAALSAQSDYTRFVARGVAPEVKNAALKKLFTDPHFNVMDGLDTYIDDYGKPDPLPAGMLRKMAQSHLMGLFDDEDKAVQAEADAASPRADVALDATGRNPHAQDHPNAQPGGSSDDAPH